MIKRCIVLVGLCSLAALAQFTPPGETAISLEEQGRGPVTTVPTLWVCIPPTPPAAGPCALKALRPVGNVTVKVDVAAGEIRLEAPVPAAVGRPVIVQAQRQTNVLQWAAVDPAIKPGVLIVVKRNGLESYTAPISDDYGSVVITNGAATITTKSTWDTSNRVVFWVQ